MSFTGNPLRRKSLQLAAMALGAALVAACGGGGDTTAASDTTTTQPKSVYATGPISGFGSIVVNGVHYEETGARILDDDDLSHDSSELKLGMIAEIHASDLREVDGMRTASASEIVFRSLMRGPVESTASDRIVVLGQTVIVTPTTVFDDDLAGGLAAIEVGDLVKVYGLLDSATGTYTATRIEAESGFEYYGLRGRVAAYDGVAGTLAIGATTFDVSGATVPDGVQAGSLVRLKLQTNQAGGMWVATSVKFDYRSPKDSDYSEVEGTITAFTSSASFSVNGLAVDASNAAFPDGTAGLAEGARVEVEGAIVAGVLVATKVELEGGNDDDEDFEVEGTISGVDPAASTFVVRGVTISYDGAVVFSHGDAGDLAPDQRVEVHAALAPDGVTLVATEIEFKF